MIAIDGRALLETSPGGIQTATVALLKALALQGSKKFLVVFPTRRSTIPDVPLPSLVLRRSNRVQLCAHAAGRGVAFDDLVERETGERPRAVFAPTLQPLRVRRAPFILVVHDCSFLRFPGWLPPRDYWWHTLLRPRSIIERATHLLCPSECTRDELTHFFPEKAERITVIPWGPPEVPDHKTPLSIPHHPSPFVLAIGASHPRKNPRMLSMLRSFCASLNPAYSLVSIDPSTPVSESVKWSLLGHAQALLAPSFYEGFGFPLVEAMRAGVPVLAASGSSAHEVVGDAGVLVSPYASFEWRQALEAVLFDEQLRETLIRRGYKRLAQFSWQRAGEHLTHLFEHL